MHAIIENKKRRMKDIQKKGNGSVVKNLVDTVKDKKTHMFSFMQSKLKKNKG